MRRERDLVSGDALQHQSRDVDDKINAEVQWNVPKLLAYVVIRIRPLVQSLIVHFWWHCVVLVVFRNVIVDHLVMEVVMLAIRVVVVVVVVVEGRMIQMAGILDRFRCCVIVVRRVGRIVGVVGGVMVVGREVGIRFVGIWWLKTMIYVSFGDATRCDCFAGIEVGISGSCRVEAYVRWNLGNGVLLPGEFFILGIDIPDNLLIIDR